MKAIAIQKQHSYIPFPEKPCLKDMYGAIGCANIDIVTLPKLSVLIFPKKDYKIDMVIDGEGKLRNRPIYNAKATLLFWWSYGEDTDLIAGRALLLKSDNDGHLYSLSQNDVFRLRQVLTSSKIRGATNWVKTKLAWRGLLQF